MPYDVHEVMAMTTMGGSVYLRSMPVPESVVLMLNGRFLRLGYLQHGRWVVFLLPIPLLEWPWWKHLASRIVWWWYGIPYGLPMELHVWYCTETTGVDGYVGGGATTSYVLKGVENKMLRDIQEGTVTGP